MLNKNVFQILLTDSGNEPPLPAAMMRNVQSLQEHHPDFVYRRFGNADLEELIKSNFETEVLEAYRLLRPLCYKADLGRFCLLLLYGGIYADMSIRLLRPIDLPAGKKMVCFRDTPGTGLWTVSTSLIFAEAGRSEFRRAIEMVCKNVKMRYYGADSLHPTGPALFGRALAAEDRAEEIDIGSFEYLTEGRSPHSIGHVDSSGRIVSIRMKRGAFTELGIPGTNDYPAIWNARQVYGETGEYFAASSLHIVEKGSPAVGRDSRGIFFKRDAVGFVVFGPHLYLAPGSYCATYIFTADSILSGLTIDVLTGENEQYEVQTQRSLGDVDALRASIDFVLSERVIYQIRLSSTGGSIGIVLGLEVETRKPTEKL